MSNQLPMAEPRSEVDTDPLGALRAADYDRSLQVLVARPADRAPLAALAHLNLELARIADLAREPMAGYIRLQWWRDALTGLARGTPPPHPVLRLAAEAGLLERLDVDRLVALVDARETELDATPIQRLDDLEAHARATAGALNAAVARICGADGDGEALATRIGTAYGLLGVVRAVPFVLRRPQPLLPTELLAGAAARPDGFAGRPDELDALRPVLALLVERAALRLDSVWGRRPRRLAPAAVPAVLARQDLARLRRRDLDVFDGRLGERPPWTMMRLLVAIARGRWA